MFRRIAEMQHFKHLEPPWLDDVLGARHAAFSPRRASAAPKPRAGARAIAATRVACDIPSASCRNAA
jgi:hypothetical protein